MTEIAVEDALFRQAMRSLSCGVTVIAAKLGDQRSGLTATAVCSFALNPARILACINLQGRTYRMIAESKRMSVNILALGQERLAKSFAGMIEERGHNPFENEDWRERATGAPVLADALVSLDCSVIQSIAFETHAILIGRVEDILIGAQRPPLVYLEGRFTTVVPECDRRRSFT